MIIGLKLHVNYIRWLNVAKVKVEKQTINLLDRAIILIKKSKCKNLEK